MECGVWCWRAPPSALRFCISFFCSGHVWPLRLTRCLRLLFCGFPLVWPLPLGCSRLSPAPLYSAPFVPCCVMACTLLQCGVSPLFCLLISCRPSSLPLHCVVMPPIILTLLSPGLIPAKLPRDRFFASLTTLWTLTAGIHVCRIGILHVTQHSRPDFHHNSRWRSRH